MSDYRKDKKDTISIGKSPAHNATVKMFGTQASTDAQPVSDTQFAYAQRGMASFHIEELIHKRKETYVHLPQSLLIRLRLHRHDGEPLSILCSSEEMNLKNIRIVLPCQLGLSPGSLMDMDLFLNPSLNPLQVHGKVKKIMRTGNEDIIRYVAEVELYHVPALTEKAISTFIRSAQNTNRWNRVAQ